MTETPRTLRDELKRVRRVSDMLCTAHASMRDYYQRLALLLDLVSLGLSLLLIAMTWVKPTISRLLTPRELEPEIWLGFIAILTFFLSLLQLRTDWKGRAEAHRRSFAVYAEVKRDAGVILSLPGELTKDQAAGIFQRYGIASEIGCEIPDKDFISLKQKHLLKVAMSSHLDCFPYSSPLLTRAKWWWRDNVRARSRDGHLSG